MPAVYNYRFLWNTVNILVFLQSSIGSGSLWLIVAKFQRIMETMRACAIYPEVIIM